MEKEIQVKTDCRKFCPDRPCSPHKTTGVLCSDCQQYSPFSEKILIIKLDALGDVLRTTSILTPLKKKYPDSLVYWLTLSNATAALENIAQIDKVLTVDSLKDSFWINCLLSDEEFDIVINTDASYKSAALARHVRAKEKIGFTLDARGTTVALSEAAGYWFSMGVNDRIKKENTRTYQSIIADIIAVPDTDMPILVNLTKDEAAYGRAVIEKAKEFSPGRPTVGINPGSGTRWPQKRWKREKYAQLIDRLNKEHNINIVLLGGPEEKEINRWIVENISTPVIDAGTEHSLRGFMGLVNTCDTVVCADTICMHIACGLKKNTVAIFGPTSAAEIDLYGRGSKIVTSVDCACCYRTDCTKSPNCMDAISLDEVFDAVNACLPHTCAVK